MQIEDEQFGFRFVVPDGFHEFTLDGADENTLYVFVDREPSPDDPANVIEIQRLRGTIDPNQRLSADEMPRIEGVTTSLSEASWRGRTVDVVTQVAETAAGEMVFHTIQFPLPDEAVQLQVGGLLERNNEIQRLFDTALASFVNTRPIVNSPTLRVRTLSPAERVARLIRGLVRLSITIAVIVLVVGFIGAKIRKKRKERQSPGQ